MALTDLAQRVYDSGQEFQMRIAAACWTYAQTIIAEDAGTTDHAARLAWAKGAVADGLVAARKLLPLICTNGTILAQGPACSDSDLQWVVNYMVDNALGLLT